MELYDRTKAAEVWQRVNTASAPPTLDTEIPLWITEETADAHTYAVLSRRMPGAISQRLRVLSQQEQAHAACLRGISTLIHDAPPEIATTVKEPSDFLIALRTCYGHAMRRLARYEAFRTDPEYGPVFERLSQQEQEHCREILELIGLLLKPRK